MMQCDFFNMEDDHVVCETIKCTMCKEHKSLDNFNKLVYASGVVEYKARCKECNAKHNKIVNTFRKLHPINKDTHECEICGVKEKDIERGRKLFVVDHCHKTETFRGWICSACNTGIGALGDDPEIVKKALAYLQKHSV